MANVKYYDSIFEVGTNNKLITYYDASALVLSIKNILLSKPGNYPLTPSLGIDISKYQFELLDDETISDIEADLSFQINKYSPIPGDAEVKVLKLSKEDGYDYNAIGISVSVILNGEKSTFNFIALQDNEIINVAVDII